MIKYFVQSVPSASQLASSQRVINTIYKCDHSISMVIVIITLVIIVKPFHIKVEVGFDVAVQTLSSLLRENCPILQLSCNHVGLIFVE